MPNQKLEGGKWYCIYRCGFSNSDREVVSEHETDHIIKMSREWLEMLKTLERENLFMGVSCGV